MTASKFSLRSPHLVLAAVVALTAACKASESGAIPCHDDSNCPTTYPQCIGGGAGSSGGTSGHCTEPVVGTPVLSPTTIGVTPPAITGGLRPTLSLALPALSGNKSLARNVTLGLPVGGGVEPVNKSGGAPVTLADLGTTITVDAPASAATDDKTFTYTLTVSNTPSSAATATATGSVHVIPLPVLAAGSFAVTPAAITGGTSPSIAVALPALSSPVSSGAVVAFTVSGCGTGAVTKSGGAAVALADLGTTIHVDAPASTASDEKICTYTLTVSNAATTPASFVATSVLAVGPLPVLSASSFTLGTASITGGNTITISLTLPTLMSASNSASAVTFAVSGPAHCGSGAVPKAAGGLVGIGDLNGTAISINSPTGTAATDDLACTYTLTVANSVGAQVQATGSFLVLPVPVLTPASLTFPAVSGGATTAGVALPALSQLTPAKATVGLAIITGTGCPPGNVIKTNNGGGSVAATDLNTTISFAPPTSATIDDKACVYKLTVSNGAVSHPAGASATGTLIVAPVPALLSTNFTLNPASITGGTPTTATLSLTLPALFSAVPVHSTNTVKFAISGDAGCGAADVPKAGGSVAVGAGDLGQPISINPRSTSLSSHLSCTYTLTLFNAANAQVTATGNLTVVPKPVFSSGSLAILPNDHIAGGTNALLNTTLPSLTSDPTYVPSGNVTFTISGGTVCGSGNVSKIVAAVLSPVVKGDLNTNISFNPPSSMSNSSDLCTYTISATNSTGTPEGTASATGTLTIVPTPSFGSNALTVTPNVFVDGTSTAGLLKFALPLLSLGTADSIAMTVSSGGAPTAVTKTLGGALVSTDLGTTISVDPPTTAVGDAAKTFTYSLTAHNNLTGDSTAVTTTATSEKVSAALPSARVASTATVLPNGSVLIVGGGTSISKGVCNLSSGSGGAGDSDTGDIYDPSTGTVTRVPLKMNFKRCQHTAALTKDGAGTYKVFIMGGAGLNDAHVDVFVYNPATPSVFGAWQASGLPQLANQRYGHSATVLGAASGSNSGRIVVAGGYVPSGGQAGTGLTSLELFDPTANANNGGSLTYQSNGTSAFNVGRGEHAAALAGKWLYFIGGFDGGTNFSPSIDALDSTLPVDNGTSGGQINHSNPPTDAIGRAAHSAIAISTTSILVAGGLGSATGLLSSLQNYTVDSSTGAVALNGVSAIGTPQNLATARARFQLLPAGPTNKFLVFGGSTTISTSAAADTATATMEEIDTTSAPTVTSFGSMALARQAFGAASLAPSTNNTTFLIAGGASTGTGGVELVVGP